MGMGRRRGKGGRRGGKNGNNKLKGLTIAPWESNAWPVTVKSVTLISARSYACSTHFLVDGHGFDARRGLGGRTFGLRVAFLTHVLAASLLF